MCGPCSAISSANIFEIPLITLNTLINCRDRVKTPGIEFFVFLSHIPRSLLHLFHFVSQSGPFMIRLVSVLPQTFSLDYACRLRRAQGIERDGSASLSVLTGKYLSRHTPPPSTTSVAVAAASVSSTHPSRSPTLSPAA